MIITNDFNLPEAIYNTIAAGIHPPKEGRISVTDLIGPPLIRQLKMKHWDKLTEDVSDRLWALLGSATHYVLEKGSPDSGIAEEKLTMERDGVTVAGVADLLHDGVISDYKITSVYSFLLGDKPEWERQLNVYSYMYGEYGFEVESLRIDAILRDWSRNKWMLDKGGKYPQIPFQSVRLRHWWLEEQSQYVSDRIRLHKSDTPPECTPDEKWARPTTYAVKVKGLKKAARVLQSQEEAEVWIKEHEESGKKYTVEVRPGENVRCQSYCPVRAVCPYNK